VTVKELIEALSEMPDYYEVGVNQTGSPRPLSEVRVRTYQAGPLVEIR
jgi:hypothetical protein